VRERGREGERVREREKEVGEAPKVGFTSSLHL
jgi:hypothetical protein